MLTKKLIVLEYLTPDLLKGRYPPALSLTVVLYWHGCISYRSAIRSHSLYKSEMIKAARVN